MMSIKFIISSVVMAMTVAACSPTDVEIRNSKKVSDMSAQLIAAAKNSKLPQSTRVTVNTKGEMLMTPISDARPGFFNDIELASSTATYVDCDTNGVHTSTACETDSCVTNAIADCSGTVEWCAQ